MKRDIRMTEVEQLKSKIQEMKKTLIKVVKIKNDNTLLTITVEKAINKLESNDAGPALTTLKLARDKIRNAGR